ncbi:CoA-binding protein [Myxosarcina sp. GI1]|uniref:succinate--CoA ligase subunit alpha n=1 Tax=Myxosarcina sp. GI1 TaxID=1541065 RepID=UPI00056B767D|nr:CoA-binding protein [Myxosarcina sp. GI1]
MNWSFARDTQVIVQGIDEPEVSDRVLALKAYGTNIVAGVSYDNNQSAKDEIPVYQLVEKAISECGQAEISLIFVPPYQVLDAGREAIAAGVRYLIIFTTGIPPLDTISLLKWAKTNNTSILGPGSHGFVIPEQVWMGTLQPQFYQAGKVGLIGNSPYLSYEVAWELNQAQLGQSIVVCLGEDKILGSSLSQWLSILSDDANTEAIVLVGRTLYETEEVIDFYERSAAKKPLIIYLAGLQAPQEKLFRNAVTIITNHLSSSIPVVNTNHQDLDRLKQAGIKIAGKPCEIPLLIEKSLKSK